MFPPGSKKQTDRDKDESPQRSTETESIYSLKQELSEYLEGSDNSLYHEVYPGTERMDYDFLLERRNTDGTNILESTSHIIKGCLGIGILCMHVGYMHGGLWTSLALTTVIGALVSYIMHMLASTAHKLYVKLRVPRLSYPHLVEAAVATGPLRCCRKYSKAFRYTTDVVLFTEVYGTCCIYQIMIANILKQVLESLSPTIEGWNLPLRIYILIVTIPLLGVSIIANLKYLAPFSLVADFFLAICIVTSMYYSLLEAGDIKERAAYKDFFGLVQFTGILLYSIDGVTVTLPIENYMTNPQYFPTVIQIAMPLVILAVTVTGFFGYWGYGEKCRTPIIIHLPFETTALFSFNILIKQPIDFTTSLVAALYTVLLVPIILDFLLIAALIVSFAINFWVPFRIVWHHIGGRHKIKRGRWERIYRVILVVLITCLSTAYPKLLELMILIGNFFISITTFIIPALVEILVTWRTHRRGTIRWRFIKNLLLIAFGVVLCIGTILCFVLF